MLWCKDYWADLEYSSSLPLNSRSRTFKTVEVRLTRVYSWMQIHCLSFVKYRADYRWLPVRGDSHKDGVMNWTSERETRWVPLYSGIGAPEYSRKPVLKRSKKTSVWSEPGVIRVPSSTHRAAERVAQLRVPFCVDVTDPPAVPFLGFS